MTTLRSGKTVVCGLLILLSACGGDDKEDGGGSSVPGCSDVCAKKAPLHCAGDMPGSCQSECDSLDDQIPTCASQARAYIACSAARPAADYACDADGEGDVIETVCTTERDAFAGCVLGGLAGMNGGAGTGGGGAGTGGSDCPFTNDGECDEPDFCPAGTDTADCGG